MKKSIIFFLFVLPFALKATNYISLNAGDWGTGTTWAPTAPAGHPNLTDNVTITLGVTMSSNEAVNTLTISSGGTLSITGSSLTLAVFGDISNSGTISAGNNGISLLGNVTIAGTGTLSFGAGTFNIGGNFTNSGTFTAGTSNVTFTGASAQAIGGAIPTTFWDLTISSGTHTTTLGDNQVISDNLTISSSSTLDVSATGNYSLTVDNNFTDNGTFLPQAGTVVMSGINANQTISSSSGSMTFNNLTTNPSSSYSITIACPITVNTSLTVSQGTFNCQINQITGGSGNFTMASGTSLILGLTSTATNVSFPSFAGTISLDPTSTVVYQANTAQTLSTSPSAYGNLILSTGTSASTKTTAASSLTVAGNLTINNSTTLSGLDGGSGILTLGGNFINNGTYTTGTGTVLFDGSGTQTIGTASDPITFYNMTISGGAGQDVQLGYATTVSNNLNITSGMLDATVSSYSLTVDGNFTESGGAFRPNSNTVSMGGTTQTLGGSATIQLYKLFIGTSGTTAVTLGGNIATGSDITISPSCTLSAGAHNINIAGNFTDDGTFNCNTSTIDFDKNGHQCVSGSHTNETFQNLTISPMSTLGTSCNINIDGTILILPGGLMACVCH